MMRSDVLNNMAGSLREAENGPIVANTPRQYEQVPDRVIETAVALEEEGEPHRVEDPPGQEPREHARSDVDGDLAGGGEHHPAQRQVGPGRILVELVDSADLGEAPRQGEGPDQGQQR